MNATLLAISIVTAALLAALPATAATPVPPVILTELGVANLGLETTIVEEADFETTVFALGRLEAAPENRSVLSSRIPGRIIENRIRIGSFVSKGEKLLLLESRQPGDPPPAVWLTAPADGTVIGADTSLGAPVEPSDRLAEIAELRTIYLIASVPQATAGAIKQGTRARVRFPVKPDREYIATLLKFAACPCPDPSCALGQDVSKRTAHDDDANRNTAGVVFTINNPDNTLRPGMNAECSIIMDTRKGVLSVPREAVQGSPSSRHVYVKHMTIPHAFDRVPVQTGLAGNDRVEILDGLFPGDEVVTRGSYSLGYAGTGGGMSLKEALDIAHGHEHNEDGSEKTPEQAAGKERGDHGHGRHDEGQGLTMRETLFMIISAVLAILLVITTLRQSRNASGTNEPG